MFAKTYTICHQSKINNLRKFDLYLRWRDSGKMGNTSSNNQFNAGEIKLKKKLILIYIHHLCISKLNQIIILLCRINF